MSCFICGGPFEFDCPMALPIPPSANFKVYQMTEFQSENSAIWHSLELAEGGIDAKDTSDLFELNLNDNHLRLC